MDVDVGTLMFDKDESLFDHLSWQNYLFKRKEKKHITTSLFSYENIFSLINKDLKCTIKPIWNLILNDQNKIDGVF